MKNKLILGVLVVGAFLIGGVATQAAGYLTAKEKWATVMDGGIEGSYKVDIYKVSDQDGTCFVAFPSKNKMNFHISCVK